MGNAQQRRYMTWLLVQHIMPKLITSVALKFQYSLVCFASIYVTTDKRITLLQKVAGDRTLARLVDTLVEEAGIATLHLSRFFPAYTENQTANSSCTHTTSSYSIVISPSAVSGAFEQINTS